jgi:hypothetical protein
MASNDPQCGDLPALDHCASYPLNEKTPPPYNKSSSSDIADDKQAYLDSEKALGNDCPHVDTVFFNGEPVVTNGRDVSRFVVDIHDDGESPLTFRSIILGTVFAGLGAALCQVFTDIHVTE